MNIFPELKKGKWVEINMNEESRKTNFEMSDAEVCTKWLESLHKEKGADYSYGGFLEDRTHIWRNHPNNSGASLIHLGVDYNVSAGTKVCLPADGKVFHIMKDPTNRRGWGGRIIFELSNGTYLIYGHLKQDFIVGLGQECKKGEVVGIIGESKENGNWFPHLHVQIMNRKFIDTHISNLNRVDGYLPQGHPNLKNVINPDVLIN